MDTPRLERLVARQLGECCEGDVDDRLRTLEAWADHAAGAADADVPALSTLGDETRYTIARLLAAADRELCVCEIEPVVDVGDSAVSHALADLRDAGLVTRRKDGTWRYYEATERATAVLSALDAARDGDATGRGGDSATGPGTDV